MIRSLLAIALVATTAHAQPIKETPAQALEKVEATYKKPAQLTATFSQANDYAATGISTTSSGTLWVSKPDKIRFDYTSKNLKKRPLDKQYLFDGATLTLIDHGNTEVTTKPAATTDLPALVKFFTGAGSLTTEFTVGAPANKNRLVPGAVVLQLSPKKSNASYAELYLVVDPTSWTVTKTVIVNSSGDTTTFTFANINTVKAQAASWFQPDPKAIRDYKRSTVGSKP